MIGDEIVARWVPVAWEAFLDYRRHATRLARFEIAIIRALATGDDARATALATEQGLLNRGEDGRLRANRERSELEEKFDAFGLRAPWRT